MASAPIEPELSSVMVPARTVPIGASELANLLHGREVIEQFIAAAISLLDLMDGNPDEEPVGDELDGSGAEDDFCGHNLPMPGPGCPLSDPDSGIEDEPHDDWNDDREDQDPTIPAYGIDQTAGPLPFQPATDLALMQPHIDRIRRTRCDVKRIAIWGAPDVVEYRLRDAGGSASSQA